MAKLALAVFVTRYVQQSSEWSNLWTHVNRTLKPSLFKLPHNPIPMKIFFENGKHIANRIISYKMNVLWSTKRYSALLKWKQKLFIRP